jgi:DHA1 family bicyclomycin/chloramphenicol resistance-like MFS transporter
MTVSPFAIDLYLPAFSQIAHDLKTNTTQLSLTVASYMIGLAIGQLFCGPLLDRVGRKKPLFSGLVIYILCCIGCALSSTISALIIFRFIQALGGCVALVAAIAMVRDFFPAQESARVLSWLMLILGASPLLAPTAGGYITTLLGWQWVFITLALLVTVILVITFIFLPQAYQPDPSVSLKIKPMVTTFISILKNRDFTTYSLSGAFSFAIIIFHVASSPVVFMELFHVSPKSYGIIFAVLAVGFVGSNQVNVLLLRKFSSSQIFSMALWGQAICTVVFAIGAWQGWFGLTGAIIMYFLCLSCIGLTYPNASALALNSLSTNIGSASALIGFLQIGIAGIGSCGLPLLKLHTYTPVIILMAITSIIALSVLVTRKRKIATSTVQTI